MKGTSIASSANIDRALVSDLLPTWIPILFAITLALPFVNKAFTIDDPVFLRQAQQIAREPLNPYGFEINWQGSLENARINLASPPLWGYLLAPVVTASDANEVAVHLFMAIWIALAAWGMVRLANRCGLGDGTGPLIFVTMPCFVVLGQTAMPDVPAVAFALHGAAELLDVRRGSSRRWPLAALLLAAACLCRLNAAAVPLALASLAFSGRQRRWPIMAATAAPLLITIAAIVFMRHDAGSTSSIARNLMLIPNPKMGLRLIALFTHLGAASLFLPIFVLALRNVPKKAISTTLAALTVTLLAWGTYSWKPDTPILAVILLSGPVAFTLWNLLLNLPSFMRDQDGLDLALWLWFMSAVAVPLVYTHFAAKYLVIASPPLILLLLRMRLRTCTSRSPLRSLRIWALVGGLAALAIGVADYRLAGLYRSFVESELPKIKQHTPGTIWFTGHWGWQWYMEHSGALAYDFSKSLIRDGDVLITVNTPSPNIRAHRLLNSLVPTAALAAPDRYPLRTMNRQIGAGFYSNTWGLLPVGLSTSPDEVFVVWKSPPK